MFELLEFNRNPHLGIYCRANDDFAFLRKGLLKVVKKKITEALDLKLIELNIANGSIIGSLLVMNSNGVVVTDLADEQVVESIKSYGFNVFVIKDRLNACGNNILVNNHGALVHPDIRRYNLKKMKEVFDVPVQYGTIAGLKTVGMAAVVTNKGLLCHPKVEEKEREILESVFGVDVMIGTVNHGVPLIGSGIVANSKGAIVGNLTTGVELGRIEEALGFLD